MARDVECVLRAEVQAVRPGVTAGPRRLRTGVRRPSSLLPFREGDAGRSFRNRILLPEFETLSAVPGDSTADVSDDRDRG